LGGGSDQILLILKVRTRRCPNRMEWVSERKEASRAAEFEGSVHWRDGIVSPEMQWAWGKAGRPVFS
jgi:hypothetical protein